MPAPTTPRKLAAVRQAEAEFINERKRETREREQMAVEESLSREARALADDGQRLLAVLWPPHVRLLLVQGLRNFQQQRVFVDNVREVARFLQMEARPPLPLGTRFPRASRAVLLHGMGYASGVAPELPDGFGAGSTITGARAEFASRQRTPTDPQLNWTSQRGGGGSAAAAGAGSASHSGTDSDSHSDSADDGDDYDDSGGAASGASAVSAAAHEYDATTQRAVLRRAGALAAAAQPARALRALRVLLRPQLRRVAREATQRDAARRAAASGIAAGAPRRQPRDGRQRWVQAKGAMRLGALRALGAGRSLKAQAVSGIKRAAAAAAGGGGGGRGGGEGGGRGGGGGGGGRGGGGGGGGRAC
eukprot:g1038.t1